VVLPSSPRASRNHRVVLKLPRRHRLAHLPSATFHRRNHRNPRGLAPDRRPGSPSSPTLSAEADSAMLASSLNPASSLMESASSMLGSLRVRDSLIPHVDWVPLCPESSPPPGISVRVRVVVSAVSMEGDPARGLGTPLPRIAATALNPRPRPPWKVSPARGLGTPRCARVPTSEVVPSSPWNRTTALGLLSPPPTYERGCPN
jgi:hypothetical protein